MQRMELYMRHLDDQQQANHRGQMQLNESFYQYTMHQQRQYPSPYPWPTPEQFGATVAWPGDMPSFQVGAGPTEAPGDEDEAQEDDDVAYVMDFFLLGGRAAWPGSLKIVNSSLF